MAENQISDNVAKQKANGSTAQVTEPSAKGTDN